MRPAPWLVANADRNLLFGILALQMDFVQCDALIAGVNAWVLHKDQPLGAILVQQAALAEEERRLLEPLVERHLARHGGDAHRSLVSVVAEPGLREALEFCRGQGRATSRDETLKAAG